jgi:hypothetical protein
VPGALYRFTAVSDDGVRIYVDDRVIIDAWYTHAVRTFTAETYLASGHHLVRVEYYEDWGDAVVSVWWTSSWETASNTWRGEYFNNRDLAGWPVLVREDAQIDFSWGWNAPAVGVNADNFSVRWGRTLHFGEGRYRFTTETDDGVRLYIDGKLVIDQWRPMSRTCHHYEIYLSAGTHSILMEYFEQTQDAVAKLTWEMVTPRRWIGNIITCVPPQPYNYAWVKVYRLEADGSWVDMAPRGIGAICATGYLKIDGLPVDHDRYGDAGHPYRVEQWIDGSLVRSVGYIQRGEPEFRVRPYADNYTPWSCSPPNG